jgi:hypothetical protein
MAQLVAHLLCKQGVRGSSPLGSTYFPLSSLLSALAGDSELRALAAINCSSWPSALIASVVLQFGLLARTRPLAFATFIPLRVRSRIRSDSNSATIADTLNSSRPAGSTQS